MLQKKKGEENNKKKEARGAAGMLIAKDINPFACKWESQGKQWLHHMSDGIQDFI